MARPGRGTLYWFHSFTWRDEPRARDGCIRKDVAVFLFLAVSYQPSVVSSVTVRFVAGPPDDQTDYVQSSSHV
jgi:hypothetical protein